MPGPSWPTPPPDLAAAVVAGSLALNAAYDDDLAPRMVEAARRAVDAAAVRPDPEPPKPHGDPLADAVPTAQPLDDHEGFPLSAGSQASSARPALTITEAARAADVDRRTIRRKLDGGALPHAYREDGDGAWRIPVEDLLAAGYRLHALDAPPNDRAGPARADAPPSPERAELAEWRRRAEVAEALATERERTIRALELALRALEPGPAPVAAPYEPASTPTPPASPGRRGRWQR